MPTILIREILRCPAVILAQCAGPVTQGQVAAEQYGRRGEQRKRATDEPSYGVARGLESENKRPS